MTAPVKAPVEIVYKATGVDQVRNGLRLVGNDANANLQKVGGASRQIAAGLESIARQGKVSGEAIKQIVAQGAEMAFMFGAGGPIVGALAITGVAIYEHLTSKAKEARDEINGARKELEDLGKGNLVTAAKRQQTLFSGDASAVRADGESYASYLARRRGVGGLRSQIERTTDAILNDPNNLHGPNRQFMIGGLVGADRGRLQAAARANAFDFGAADPDPKLAQLVELFQQLAKLEPQFNAISRITDNLAKRADQTDTLNLAGQRFQTRQDILKDLREGAAEFAMNLQTTGGVQTIQQFHRGMDRSDRVQLGNQIIEMGGPAKASDPETTRTMRSKTEQIIRTFATEVQIPLGNAIRQGIGSTIGSAISDGIAAGFESGSIGHAFKAAGKAILAGLGGIMTQMGEVWLTYGIQMTALGQALWNPLTSGPAAIAIGASLIALGSALGAVAHGRYNSDNGGAASSYSAPPTIIDRGTINPTSVGSAASMTPRTPVTFNVIGERDPVAMRTIMTLIKNAQERGEI